MSVGLSTEQPLRSLNGNCALSKNQTQMCAAAALFPNSGPSSSYFLCNQIRKILWLLFYLFSEQKTPHFIEQLPIY